MAGPEASQQATIDWRRLAADKNVAIDVARGLWEQAKAAGGDPVARSSLFRRLLDDAAKNPSAVPEPGKSTLVDSKGPTDPATLGAGKTTLVLLDAQMHGAAATPSDATSEAAPAPAKDAAAANDAAGPGPGVDANKKDDPPTAPPTVDKLRGDLVAAAQASQDAAALLATADAATIVEALKQLRAGSPTILQKVLTVAGAAIERIIGQQLPDPTQAKADGPPGIRVPFVGGEGEVHTHFMSDDGVPMVSTPMSVAQKVAEWRAEIQARQPADQESLAPAIARASGLNTSAGDQAKQAKLGDEPAKTALPDTQKQLAATLGTISRELAAKPPQPPTPAAGPEAGPMADASADAPTATPAPPAATAQPAPSAAAQPPAGLAPTQPDSAQQQQPETQQQQQQAQTQDPQQQQPTAQQQQQPAQTQAPTQQPAAPQAGASDQQSADKDKQQEPATTTSVPLTYEAYKAHIRATFAAQIGELDQLAQQLEATDAENVRLTTPFKQTLEDVAKLQKAFDEAKATLDEEKINKAAAKLKAATLAQPNAGSTMPQLLEKAKVLVAAIKEKGEDAAAEKKQLEGVMQASMKLGTQIDKASTEKGRALYVAIDVNENSALLEKARASGMLAKDVAEMAVNHRNWLRALWRNEIMKDKNHSEILFLRDEGKTGSRDGQSFDQVIAKVVDAMKTIDPKTKKAALGPGFQLETATPEQLDQIYQGVIESAGTTNASVNATAGVGDKPAPIPQPGAQQTPQPGMQQTLQPGMQQTLQPGAQQVQQPEAQQTPQPGMQQTLQPGAQQAQQPEAQQTPQTPAGPTAGVTAAPGQPQLDAAALPPLAEPVLAEPVSEAVTAGPHQGLLVADPVAREVYFDLGTRKAFAEGVASLARLLPENARPEANELAVEAAPIRHELTPPAAGAAGNAPSPGARAGVLSRIRSMLSGIGRRIASLFSSGPDPLALPPGQPNQQQADQPPIPPQNEPPAQVHDQPPQEQNQAQQNHAPTTQQDQPPTPQQNQPPTPQQNQPPAPQQNQPPAPQQDQEPQQQAQSPNQPTQDQPPAQAEQTPNQTPQEQLQDAVTARDATRVNQLATTDEQRNQVLEQVKADLAFLDRLLAESRATWSRPIIALSLRMNNADRVKRFATDLSSKTDAVKEAVTQAKAELLLIAIGSSGDATWRTATSAADFNALIGALAGPIRIREINAGVWLLWGDGAGRDATAGRLMFSKLYSARILAPGDTSVWWDGGTVTEGTPAVTFELRYLYMPVTPNAETLKTLLNSIRTIPPAHVDESQIAFVNQNQKQWRRIAPAPLTSWANFTPAVLETLTTSYYLANCRSVVFASTAGGAITTEGATPVGIRPDANPTAVGGTLASSPDGLLNIFQNHARHEIGHAVGARVFQGMAESGDDFALGYGGWAASSAAAMIAAYWKKNGTTEIDWRPCGGVEKQRINDADVATYLVGLIEHGTQPTGNAITALPGATAAAKLALLQPNYADQDLWKYFAAIGGLTNLAGAKGNGYMFPGFTPTGDDVHIWCSRSNPVGFTKYSTAAYQAMVSSHGWYSLASHKEMFAELYTKKYAGGAAPGAVNGKDPGAFFRQLELSSDTNTLTSVVPVPPAPATGEAAPPTGTAPAPTGAATPALPENTPVTPPSPTSGTPSKPPALG